MNIAIIDDVQQDLDALVEATREHYDQRQISIQLHTFSSPEASGTAILRLVMTCIFLDIYIVSRICFLNLWLSALAETEQDHRPVSMLFLYAPPLIIAKRRLQSCLLRISPDLPHDYRKLPEIAGAYLLQIRDFPETPFFIFLFWQYANLHQHIHRCGIAPPLALVVNRSMGFPA